MKTLINESCVALDYGDDADTLQLIESNNKIADIPKINTFFTNKHSNENSTRKVRRMKYYDNMKLQPVTSFY